MNNKNTILIAITVAAFAVTGFLVYKSFARPGDPAAEAGLPAASQAPLSPLNILPLGNKFDTAPVKKVNSQFNVHVIPKVLPESVGVNISNLIKSPVESSPGP